MAELPPLKKLDTILSKIASCSTSSGSLYPKCTWADIVAFIRGNFTEEEFSSEDIRLSIERLILDRNIKENPKEQENLETGEKTIHHTDYEITFDGKILNSQNGYSQIKIDRDSEMIRLGILESATTANRNILTVLTVIIAAGTLVAGIYYLIEILNKLQCH
jgi:hypothetical protein